MVFSWTCPYCNQNATITQNNFHNSDFKFYYRNKYDEDLTFKTSIIICPNDQCRDFTISANLLKDTETILNWQLKPNSSAKQYPDYIPQAILDDYNEACLIRDLSPKASATLSRRCLQGMIRDFWGESKNTLNEEIKAIKDKIDPIIWQAIDAVRKIGNIGAHMEKDIDLIIDVEPNEAQMLIGLIEILLKEWYVARYERKKQLEDLIGLDAIKSEQKNTPKLVNE